jgi:uncharacterized phage protein (TIGR02218 family)
MAGDYIEKVQKREVETIVEVYRIENVNAEEYYTSSKETVNFGGQDYLPLPGLKRTAPNFDLQFKSVQLTVTLPLVPSLQTYIANSPVLPTAITITRVFKNDVADYLTIFSGIVTRVSFHNKQVSATCENFSELFRKKAPNLVVQKDCNNRLFDSRCTLIKANFSTVEVVTISSDGYTLTHPAYGALGDGYFTGGEAIWNNNNRFVVAHTGNDIQLQIPFPSAIGSSNTVAAYPGCDKSGETCSDKFDNLDNFLGMPYCPGNTRNPAVVGLASGSPS